MWAWLASRSCSGPAPLSASQSPALQWTIYILFSSCGLHFLQASFHLFFFSILTVSLLAQRRKTRQQQDGKSRLQGSGVIAEGSWMSTAEAVFAAIQALAWTVFTLIVGHELPKSSAERSRPLRTWWVTNSLLSILQFASAVARLAGYGFTYSISLRVDDMVNIVVFPVSIFLLVISVGGQTGIRRRTADGLTEPLLEGTGDEIVDTKVTRYSTAPLLNRAFWIWLNPVLTKGAATTLQIEDVPELAHEDRAERLYALFQSKWPGDQSKHPTMMAIIRSFKGQFAFNALLAFCRAVSMFVGPSLIQSFSNFLESSPRYYSEGYLLAFILLVAKLVEVLSTHHYQFLSGKLGMTIRSCLITSIYRKGLKLSNSSRLSHGAGQIVNYMSVDVQQINDSIVQLNNTWMLPLQVVIALLILFGAIGVATFAGLLTMILVAALITQNSKLLKNYSMQIMMKKDIRMKATTEVLSYMKIIKLQAWEDYFRKKVEDARHEEYKSLTKFHAALAFNIFVVGVSTSVVTVVSFWVCLLVNSEFTAAKAFTVISIFNILSEPVRTFPQAVIALSQAFISLKRLDKYFLSGELEGYVNRDSPREPGYSIIVENGHFTWDEEQPSPILQDINVKVRQGDLVAIVGTVGAGKSSLLAALLGEMPKLKGYVEVTGTTAYVPQTAWIQSGTVQENILFGLPLDGAKYHRTIKACALEQDFAMFEFGDQTEIGERGINLSGGQKQRIQLARAVYQESDVYLLDDVFSAVDAHTGSALFKDCLLGILKKKTRVLVTHQVEFLHKVDLILVVQNGVIEQSGTYADLLKAGAEFGALVAAHKKAIGEVQEVPQQGVVLMEEFSVGSPPNLSVDKYDDSVKLLRRLSSTSRSQERILKSRSSGSFSKANGREEVGKLVEAEKRESGRVGWNVYWLYLTSAYGAWFIFLALGVQIIAQAFSVCADFWLSHETSQTTFNGVLLIAVYALLSVGNWVFTAARQVAMALFSLKASQAFYLKMLGSVFRAPMSFFDTTPTGRILTRSSTDQATVDIMLPLAFVLGLALYSSTFGVVIVTCIVTWPIVFVVLPLAWVYFKYQAFYLRSSREIARLDSVTKAPVIHHFTETIAGFMVIRGFRKTDQFIKMNLDRVNTNLKMDFHSTAANDWLGCRLELIGAVVLCGAALMLVILPSSFITPASAALSLSYGLSLNSVLAASVFFSCLVENKMVSVERIGQYIQLPSEAPLTIEGSVPYTDWPRLGNISMKHLKARYQPNMPFVLKGISLDIVGGQKIGVVGRTGSGKSTLIQVLFRIIEPAGGLILFDNVDITTVGLHDLRSKLGIIPQDPVLFQGTIRTNMDPLMVHTDDEIWEGLRKCQLAEIVQARPDKLDAIVVDNGENWSVGQRQLICLGRALLKKSHILFLDEATASVDAQTDAVLQTVIREEFLNSTVISIAHRIPTVMDCDMVMVLEAGLLKEYDSPARLREDSSSLFAALVNEYTARSRS
ncbi:hypothetical protein GOP47_0019454 [Adiantum capillus-veneris]|uniref:Uncharacterized protein n=1 Tax=Adiantum capillus-veneris TaxID=13818 RepID=A0A9D4UB27_ADICA|nr:hypothetical protein GOP47_0019454 [Adiantum capillus-veneris]